MPDREKVIKICEEVIKVGSPFGTDAMTYSFYYDVIALLKEQEDVSNALVDQCDRVRRLRKELAEQPQIVRCENCKFIDESVKTRFFCGRLMRCVDADWFCADGERRAE